MMKEQGCVRLVIFTVGLLCAVFLSFVTPASVHRPEILDSSDKCRRRFDYKYYYDHGTDNCEQCREICQNAEIMRTEDQCKEECPYYLNAQKCEKNVDKYYDENLDMCSPCSSLCDNHQQTGSTRDCREHCKAYLEKLTPKQVPSHHKQNHLKAVDGSDAEDDSQNSELLIHPGWIAAMAVGGVAVVCLLVVVIILYWTCSQQQQQQQYGPAPQQDEDGGVGEEQRGRHQAPVEETSQASGSQHFAIDGASTGLPPTARSQIPQDPVTYVFSDLQDNGQRV
ncbi:uncharacterized protein LOC143296640 [Babylonia areolata]|uniref:uncharacterized protein LOC143296640 n=1 Tax=Babylonia areolata TaxID=304850 RepID=UPI003FD51701